MKDKKRLRQPKQLKDQELKILLGEDSSMERRLLTCELLLERQSWKGFLHCLVTGNAKFIYHDNQKREKSFNKPRHFLKLKLCICWDQLGVVFYELLKPNEPIIGGRYELQLIGLK